MFKLLQNTRRVLPITSKNTYIAIRPATQSVYLTKTVADYLFPDKTEKSIELDIAVSDTHLLLSRKTEDNKLPFIGERDAGLTINNPNLVETLIKHFGLHETEITRHPITSEDIKYGMPLLIKIK